MTKKQIEALKKAHDAYELKRKEKEQFNKKLFPNGVLKPGEGGKLPFWDIDMNQLSSELDRAMSNDFAQRLQDIQDSKQKNQKESADKRKEGTNKRIERLLKKHNVVINASTTAPQIVNKLIDKGAKKIPDVKTFRKYLDQKNKKGN